MENIKISEKVITPEDVKKELERKNKFPAIVDKKTKENFPPTKEALDKSKQDREKLSTEKLQKITNHEFLKISPENRLQYITKNNIKTEKVSSGEVKNLEFTFTFDGEFNKELYLKTTAGQVLPREVGTVKKDGETYTRNNLKGEFFNNSGKRLIIKEATKIDVEKIRTSEEIKKLEDSNNKALQAFEKSKDYKKEYSDIVSEAIKRGIDPKFAILAFSEKVKDLPLVSQERKVLVEDMFTEFDRKKGKIPGVFENKKEAVEISILREYTSNWKQKAKEYGIKESEIKRIENLHIAKYLNLTTRAEIVNKAPEYIKNLVKKYFPPSEYENALLVCHGESGFDKNAINNKNKNGTIDRGLFQINSIHYDKYAGKNIFDPETNVKVAVQIFNEAHQTWKPWYAARKIGLA